MSSPLKTTGGVSPVKKITSKSVAGKHGIKGTSTKSGRGGYSKAGAPGVNVHGYTSRSWMGYTPGGIGGTGKTSDFSSILDKNKIYTVDLGLKDGAKTSYDKAWADHGKGWQEKGMKIMHGPNKGKIIKFKDQAEYEAHMDEFWKSEEGIALRKKRKGGGGHFSITGPSGNVILETDKPGEYEYKH